MRVVFIGSVEFSASMLRALVAHDPSLIVGVVTRKASKFQSDFCSLEPIAREFGIPVFLAEGRDDKRIVEFCEGLAPTVIFCFGWSMLLHARVLKFPPLGVFGYHPTALPQNRGRHPIIWALALGLSETASTFFKMVEEADAGPIVSQKSIAISPDDDAGSLYKRLTDAAADQVLDLVRHLEAGSVVYREQDHAKANTWRQRTEKDGLIDWRMSATSIHNLVRALTHPYVGAHIGRADGNARVWRTSLQEDKAPSNLEPGRIVRILSDNVIVVKCGAGTIRLIDHELPAGFSTGDLI